MFVFLFLVLESFSRLLHKLNVSWKNNSSILSFSRSFFMPRLQLLPRFRNNGRCYEKTTPLTMRDYVAAHFSECDMVTTISQAQWP